MLLKIDEMRNYLLDEIKYDDILSEKYKNVCRCLNYLEQFFVFDSAVSDCVSISTFFSLVAVLVGIVSPAAGLKFCAIFAGFKKI